MCHFLDRDPVSERLVKRLRITGKRTAGKRLINTLGYLQRPSGGKN